MKIYILRNAFIVLVSISIALSSIAQEIEAQFAHFTLSLNHIVGERPLILENETYVNFSGEKFSVTTFNYFISNIILVRDNDEEYIVPQDDSYFLIKEDNPLSKEIELLIPEGRYKTVKFMVGVDSLRSIADLSRRTGALDIAGGMLEGMYWTWNSGYIFVKLEGNCDQVAVDRTGQKKFRYHIGGFGGYKTPSLNNIKTVAIDLPRRGRIKAKNGKNTTVALQVDLLKIFDGNTLISLKENPAIMFGNTSKAVAENYSKMFDHLSTENRRR